LQAYQRHLARDLHKDEDANSLEETIKLLHHTSRVVTFFTDKQAIHTVFDNCIKHLDGLLTYFSCWKSVTESAKKFILDKLWFDIQSMVHGFKAITQIKLEKLPESAIKPWFINEDVVETISVKYVLAMGKTIILHIDYRSQRKIQSDMGKQLYLQSAMLHAD
jgi:hypothetical protein